MMTNNDLTRMVDAIKILEVALDASPEEIIDSFVRNGMLTKQEAQTVLISCSYEQNV